MDETALKRLAVIAGHLRIAQQERPPYLFPGIQARLLPEQLKQDENAEICPDQTEFVKVMGYRGINISDDMSNSQKAFYRRMKRIF